MPRNRFAIAVAIAASFAASFAASCAGGPPEGLGVHDGALALCPPSPDCVSSESSDSAHMIPAFYLTVDPASAWKATRESVATMPGATIVTEGADYLHAEFRGRMPGLVDDLELHLRAEAAIIAVRSASRSGLSGSGGNRRRVETLRNQLYVLRVLEHEIGGSD